VFVFVFVFVFVLVHGHGHGHVLEHELAQIAQLPLPHVDNQ
jgi:hypothetical protein